MKQRRHQNDRRSYGENRSKAGCRLARGPGAPGVGKPLRSITHGDPSLKVYMASITPAGLRTSGECADGVLPITPLFRNDGGR